MKIFGNATGKPGPARRRTALTPIAAALMISAYTQQATAFQFDTGSDWDIRWDNTVKFNYMVRAEDIKEGIVAGDRGALADDADLGWDQWDTVSTRFDLLSELDVVWKDKMGFRITGAGWHDFAYDESNHPGDNPYLGGANTWGFLSVLPPDFTDEAQDWNETGGELLDAFVFYNFTVGDMSGNLRAGRHTIYWGNSLLLTGAVHGVAGSMVAIDVAKGFAVPGSEAQELFLPTNKISTVLQITPNLTLNAYYSLEYQEYRIPPEGTYFSPAEIFTDDGAEFITLAPGFGFPGDEGFRPRLGQKKISDETPGDNNGEFGINLQYYFNAWDLEAQVFYLNYANKVQQGLSGTLDFPATVATFGAAGVAPFDSFYPTFAGPPESLPTGALGIGEFNWTFQEDIDLFGFALSKEIAGMSVGLEYVYRYQTTLRPELGLSLRRIAMLPDPLKPALGAAGITEFDIRAVDTDSNYPGPVGDTHHVIINTVGLLKGTPLWDGGNFIVEFVASMMSDVDDNGYQDLLNVNVEEDDISTHIAFAFNPEYYQVFPGTDMKIPMSLSYTLDTNNEPVTGLGGNPGVGTGSIGVEFNINQTWTVNGKYNAFFGSNDNGLLGLLTDRDNISFTVKRTF
jgi:Protein of unknown function (DUF1302)